MVDGDAVVRRCRGDTARSHTVNLGARTAHGRLGAVATDELGAAEQLRALRTSADEDYASPPVQRIPGRHQADVAELGVRVAVTRSRYPNRDDGVDQYAVTVSRLAMDRAPDDTAVRSVLELGFGDRGAGAVERTGGGPLVRMFRVRAG